MSHSVEASRKKERKGRDGDEGWGGKKEGEKKEVIKRKIKRTSGKKKFALNGDGNGETREAAAKRGFAFLLIEPRRRGLRS